MASQDTIERELVLKANIDKVWDAITNPEQLNQWFGDTANIPILAEGEPIVFGWGDDLSKGIIQTVNRPNVFAFRWQSSRLGRTSEFHEDYSTLVTFTLTAIPTGTHLHMIETGFSDLPDKIIDNAVATSPTTTPVDDVDIKLAHNELAYKDNVSGWTHEFNDLKAFFEQEQ